MKRTTLKKIAAAFLAGAMTLSFASCALFGNSKEITEAADTFAAALVKMDSKKILKLTSEKKDSKDAAALTDLLNKDFYSADANKFVDAVADTLTYEVKSDTVQSDKEKASVDVVFTSVDYEKTLKKGGFENIDSLVDALKDCEDTKEVTVKIEFENKNDKWLVSNIGDRDYKKLYEFRTCELGLTPNFASMITDSDFAIANDYIYFDVLFSMDVEEYEDFFTYDVYIDGVLTWEEEDAEVNEGMVSCLYENNWNSLEAGEYTFVLKYDGEEITTNTTSVMPVIEPVAYYDYDYGQYDDNVQIYTYGYGSDVIDVWSYMMDTANIVEKYMELNPSYASDYTVVVSVFDSWVYNEALEDGLNGYFNVAPDMYMVEGAYALKYTQGDMSYYAAEYEDLGINVDLLVSEADLAPYSVDIGTKDGEIVALSYQSTSGAMFYRRSIAMDVFGTDDPEEIEEIVGGGTGSWDKFYDAAEACADNGVAIISGQNDLWYPIKSSTESWFDNGVFDYDSNRFDFFDMAYTFSDNGWTNHTQPWTDAWYADMAGNGEKPVFCFFGPAWLLSYVISYNCGDTYGDWAVCNAPVGYFWGGTWVLAHVNTDQPEGVAELIEWMTLDTSTSGLQYLWANDIFDNGVKDAVVSNAVMAMCDGTCDMLDGQNMYSVFITANQNASADTMSQYDEPIDSAFQTAVWNYAEPNGDYYGDKTGALSDFEDNLWY